MATLLTINTTVPGRELPGTPVVVFYDNGDWEIAFSGDVDFIRARGETFAGSSLIIDVLIDVATELDTHDIDETDEIANLFISEKVNVGSPYEPLLVLYDDGETDVYDRYTAENLIARPESGVFNFIPIVDLFEELRAFVSQRREEMFEWRENDLIIGDPDDVESE